jgi:hypothetical protein
MIAFPGYVGQPCLYCGERAHDGEYIPLGFLVKVPLEVSDPGLFTAEQLTAFEVANSNRQAHA